MPVQTGASYRACYATFLKTDKRSGSVPPTREAGDVDKVDLQASLSRFDRATVEPIPDPNTLRQRIDAVLADWRGLAARHVQATRQLRRKLLVGRITFAPQSPGVIRFTGQGTLAPLVGMLQIPGVQGLVSMAPTGFEPVIESRPRFRSRVA